MSRRSRYRPHKPSASPNRTTAGGAIGMARSVPIARVRAAANTVGKPSPLTVRPAVPPAGTTPATCDRSTPTGHISRNWFRRQVWLPALAEADLGVKERLGHGSITTTKKYLHALPHADRAALTALDAIREPDTGNGREGCRTHRTRAHGRRAEGNHSGCIGHSSQARVTGTSPGLGLTRCVAEHTEPT
jgi:hypothetical protein